MTGKPNKPGKQSAPGKQPEDASKHADEMAPETHDAEDAVIDAEFSDETDDDASAKVGGDALTEDADAKATQNEDNEDDLGDETVAAGAAALALAAGAADKAEAGRMEAGEAGAEKSGSGKLVFAWLVVLTLLVLGGLYILLLNPNMLRDRMALDGAPAFKAQASQTAAAVATSKANADAISSNTVTLSQVQAMQEETNAAAHAAGIAAEEANSAVEAAAAEASAPDIAIQGAVDELKGQLGSLEADVTKLKSAIGRASSNVVGNDGVDGLALAAAAEAADSALAAASAAKAASTALGAKVDEASGAIAALSARIATLEAKAAQRGPISLASAILSLQDLRSGLASGKPFAKLLARAQAALPKAATLQNGAWAAFADTGLPTHDALLAEMQAQSVAIGQDKLKAKLAGSGDSWFDRAVGGVVDRLKVRRVGAGVEGDGPAAVAARAEAALLAGDLAKAVEEVESLSGAEADRFKQWLGQAKARAAASQDIDAVEKAAIAAADGA